MNIVNWRVKWDACSSLVQTLGNVWFHNFYNPSTYIYIYIQDWVVIQLWPLYPKGHRPSNTNPTRLYPAEGTTWISPSHPIAPQRHGDGVDLKLGLRGSWLIVLAQVIVISWQTTLDPHAETRWIGIIIPLRLEKHVGKHALRRGFASWMVDKICKAVCQCEAFAPSPSSWSRPKDILVYE